MRTIGAHAAVVLAGLALLAAPDAGAAGLQGFQSPSGNIGCVISATAARCDIEKKDWPTPARPASCELDYGAGLEVLRRSSRGRFVCAGDTTLGAGPRLAYGKRITRGSITCSSRASGMSCANAKGHGFRISRQSYRRF